MRRSMMIVACVASLAALLFCQAAFAQLTLPASVDLLADQTLDIGQVRVGIDAGGNVIVGIRTVGGWEMDETHLYVGSAPPTWHAPGRFPYKHEALGWVTLDWYNLGPLAAGTWYIAVQAEVRLLVDAGTPDPGDEIYEYESAWAEGDRIREKGPWAMYFSVEVPVR